MPQPSESEKQKIWEEVREEFPHDEMMQEIHFVRLLHYYQTKDMSLQEKIDFYSKGRKPAA